MKIKTIALCLVLLSSPAWGAHQHSSRSQKPAKIMSGVGETHHPVSTSNPKAQAFFDQGLALIFAFNHDEAERSFRRAGELDPDLAMAWWGVALAVGPNYNMDVDPAREKTAYEAIKKAQELEGNASDNEKAYIEALSKRFSGDPKADLKKLAVNYKVAMGEVVQRFPDDLDAATLYADSAMNLHPWQLWAKDGTPTEGTEEVVTTLESVLSRNPEHVGANHLYIHAVEASTTPQRALASADRLGGLAPEAGHLVHMPSHIYYRIGRFDSSARANDLAARVDRAYFKKSHAQGTYPMMYYSHNLHFLAMSYAMEGRFRDAHVAADQLNEHVHPFLSDKTMAPEMKAFVEMVEMMPTFVMLRFGRWDDVLRVSRPEPAGAASDALWNFARGSAYAAKGDAESAEAEREAFVAAVKVIRADEMFGYDKATDVMKVPEHLLNARIAMARHDNQTAIAELRAATAAQDALAYSEPPNWYYPVRETLGGELLRTGSHKEAEQVFREDLAINPNNARSLFGLREALIAQARTEDARFVDKHFAAAWKNADSQLRVEDL